MYFIPFFSPLRNASARGFEMKVLFNNNLPNQAGDVIVNPINPVNPDSKPHTAGRIISNKDWVHSIRFGCGDGYFLGIFPVNNFESRI